jgi:AcrR family transcriptional regulator
MGAKDKREKERLEAIDRRKHDVINAAKAVFSEKSIEKATMQDIALKAEVGVASVYRYYTTKIELVLAVAKDYWENGLHFDEALLFGTGIEQTTQIMNQLYQQLTQNKEMLLFMDQLDAFMMNSENAAYPIEAYKKMMASNIARLIQVIEKGKEDGTIRQDIHSEEASNTCVDLFVTLAQKLILREQVFNVKIPQGACSTLEVYKEMIIKYLETA